MRGRETGMCLILSNPSPGDSSAFQILASYTWVKLEIDS